MNKRGQESGQGEEDIVYPTIIFLVFNIMFFVILLGFATRAASGDFVYEQSYAKEIALVVDNAKPEMIIYMNVDELVAAAKNSQHLTAGASNEDVLRKIVRVNKETNEIIVSMTGEGGYSFQYFGDYNVDIGPGPAGAMLKINVSEKT